jgi:hypothetical protein
MDFGQLKLPTGVKLPTDPFQIFSSLPRIDGAPNDLWRGQGDALTEWNQNRTANDILISLNTGAGKTVVGLLMAKSLVNEGLENVLYVCPTNDLVDQTKKEAESIGISVTTRTYGDFDNDLFETGKSFCITNYHAVFNGFSAIRKKFFPEAVIFDDAHVAETVMRDCFKIEFNVKDSTFNKFVNLFDDAFKKLNRHGAYRDACTQKLVASQPVMVPPDIVFDLQNQISVIMGQSGVENDEKQKFAYHHLKDHVHKCCYIFRNGTLEITPAFLPSLYLDVFDQNVRRIYLSATLQNKADIVRAFGRPPSLTIEPKNDAGNGERLILNEKFLGFKKSLGEDFACNLSAKGKVLIAVPSYPQADKNWRKAGSAPLVNNFSAELESFRSKKTGAFVLVSRVDGIDLPNDTCRIMIIDGIPYGSSLIEKYQSESLGMSNFFSSRIANRIVQLFGRINRGRSDYGAYIITGRDLSNWIEKPKNLARLPELLQKQIMLGQSVQDGLDIRSFEKFVEIVENVVIKKPRDPQWLAYYSQYIDTKMIEPDITQKAIAAEERNFASAKAEAEFGKWFWMDEFAKARSLLEAVVEEVSRSDPRLAGWLNVWIATCYHAEGDDGECYRHFARARSQIGLGMIVNTGPIAGNEILTNDTPYSLLQSNATRSLFLKADAFNSEIKKTRAGIAALEGGTANQAEDAVQKLGELLGFVSSRPDKEDGTGPDVLWIDETSNSSLCIELKTDKNPDSALSKDEISQGHDHLSWAESNIGDSDNLGLLIVSDASRVSDQANPSQNMYRVPLRTLKEISDEILAILEDGQKLIPSEKRRLIDGLGENWHLRTLSERLFVEPIKS